MSPGNFQPTVMVVDDTPENLSVLEGMLRQQGCRVVSFPRGELALAAAIRHPPDLILLDIRMPGLDGYEVCVRLKADACVRNIPVIFISALDDTVDKVRAFGVGGVDYITKPFQLDEVMARVSAHLQLRQLRQELQEKYDQLQHVEQLRDNLVHMVVHDMRNLLMGVGGVLDTIAFEEKREDDKLVNFGRESCRELRFMITSLLDVHRLEEGKMPLEKRSCDLREIMEKAVAQFVHLPSGVRVLQEWPGDAVMVSCDANLIGRVVVNLLGNAFKFTGECGTVSVAAERVAGSVRITVTDTGPGISSEFHEKIFEKFGQLEVRKQGEKHSTGLGLTFCKLAVEAHGGRIGVRSEVGKGSSFWFELPE